MLRALSIFGGIILGALCAYLSAYIVGWFFGPLYNSEEDMARNFKFFLLVAIIFSLIGAAVANHIYLKFANTSKPNQ
jgi:predicted membrane-bound spermidine synthase